MRLVLIVFAVAFVISGCCSTIRGAVDRRAAADFNCPRDSITVESIGGNAYRANGCGNQATYACVGGDAYTCPTCVRDSDPPSPAASPAPSQAAPSSRPVEVVRVDQQGVTALVVLVPMTGLQLRLVGTPAVNPNEALLGLMVPTSAATYEGCQLAVTVDGERLQLPATTYGRQSDNQLLEVQIPLTSVERIGIGETVEGRACTARFELSPHTQGAIRSFLAEFRAELARNPPPPPAAEPPAP